MIPFLLFALTLHAETIPLVVTASRDATFSSATVNGEEWERRGARVEEALALPGVSFAPNGGPGQSRSLFIRGARSEDTLVLVDGIPLNDPSNVARSYDFAQWPTDEIERIEVSKGPHSVLYGSDAMGGVVQIFTRRQAERARLRVEGGSYGTLRARAAHLGFHAGYEKSDGFSAADERQGNTERDANRSWNLGGAKDFSLAPDTSLRVQGLYQQNQTDTDRNGGPGGDSAGTFAKASRLLFRAETFHVSNGYEWTTAGSLHSRVRDDNTNGGPDFYRAHLWRAESRVQRSFGSHTPVAGVEYNEEAGRSSQFTNRRSFRTGAAFLQDQYADGRWQLTLGGRFDLHSEYGRAWNARAGVGYWLVAESLRAKASVGTGFKAPSLYQTYSAAGTPGLRPSRILGGDAGFEFLSEDWNAELSYYENRYHNLIDYVYATAPARSYFANTGRALTRGVEAGVTRRFGFFSVKNSLTTIRAVDTVTGQKLKRRPAFGNTLELAFRKGDFVGATARFRYVGRRVDTDPTSAVGAAQNMPGFLVVGMDFFHRLDEDWKLVARGDNLLNRHYQEVSGYGTPAVSGYLGAEAEF